MHMLIAFGVITAATFIVAWFILGLGNAFGGRRSGWRDVRWAVLLALVVGAVGALIVGGIWAGVAALFGS